MPLRCTHSHHLQRFAAASALRIGLLGGSFNPAHDGHVTISLQAMKRLRLDAVWWIVSPSNPLKDPATLAPFDVRVALATDAIHSHPHLHLCLVEEAWQLRYTHATLTRLTQRFPQHRFIWLMGADNLHGFHRWQRFEKIAMQMPMAVFDRAPCTYAPLYAKTAVRLRRFRASPEQIRACTHSPAWSMLFLRRHPMSATHLRKSLGMDAFLGHNVKVRVEPFTRNELEESVLSAQML
jgi:nicotinate-nucleotide adenylyltransferase